jgi:hypothetical protein
MLKHEIQLSVAIQHLITTARSKAYYQEDHARIAELLDRADHFCNLLKEGVEYERLASILDDTAEQFSECSREILTGIVTE